MYIVSFKKYFIYLVAPKICSPRVSNSAACTELLKTKIDQLQNDIDTVSRPKTIKPETLASVASLWSHGVVPEP